MCSASARATGSKKEFKFPFQTFPPCMQYVLKALAAGKAVLSEKPISACFADAKNAIEASRKICRPVAPKPLWFVAENFRFESVFEEAARLVPLCGGVGRVDLVAEAPLNCWCIVYKLLVYLCFGDFPCHVLFGCKEFNTGVSTKYWCFTNFVD